MQGKQRYLAISLSLAEYFHEKEETTVLDRVAFLLRFSIYTADVKNRQHFQDIKHIAEIRIKT